MYSDNQLRQQIKFLKVLNNINYKTISNELGIKPKSFYSWLKGSFNLSPENNRKLETIINKYRKDD